jgi:TolB-like protein/Flp pilus assembly protein TadD
MAVHAVGGENWCFEGFTLDLRRAYLLSGTEEIALRPKSFDVLRYLVENAGRLVSKGELIGSIWSNVIVSDESVTRCVCDVRLALGDRNQRLIRTVPKRGYLFMAPLTAPTKDTEPVLEEAGHRPTAVAPAPPLSLVVFPFTNLNRNAATGGFADAITDSLTTELSRLPDYFVVARKSALIYKGRDADVRQIGRELGVRYVVEGSVQRKASRIRVSSQLVDVETGAHLWAERFDKTVGDLLDMQQEITTRLARALDVRLVAAEELRLQHVQSDNMSSVEFGLRGWAIFFRTLSARGMPEARGMFEEALRLDGGNVDALFGLSETHMWEVNCHLSNNRAEQMEVAEAAISRAQALTPNDPRIRFGRAAILLAMRLPEQALREIGIAIDAAPDLPWLHASAGRLKIFIGRAEETEGHLKEAIRLSPCDPLLGIWCCTLGVADLHLGRLNKAVEFLQRSVDLHPAYEISHFYLAAALAEVGSATEAARACFVGLSLAPTFGLGKLRAEAESANPIFLAQRERICEGMRRAGLPEVSDATIRVCGSNSEARRRSSLGRFR